MLGDIVAPWHVCSKDLQKISSSASAKHLYFKNEEKTGTFVCDRRVKVQKSMHSNPQNETKSSQHASTRSLILVSPPSGTETASNIKQDLEPESGSSLNVPSRPRSASSGKVFRSQGSWNDTNQLPTSTTVTIPPASMTDFKDTVATSHPISTGDQPALHQQTKQLNGNQENKERVTRFMQLLLSLEKLIEALGYLENCSVRLDPFLSANVHGDVFGDVPVALSCCKKAIHIMKDVISRSSALHLNIGAPIRQVVYLISESLLNFCDNSSQSIRQLEEFLNKHVETKIQLPDFQQFLGPSAAVLLVYETVKSMSQCITQLSQIIPCSNTESTQLKDAMQNAMHLQERATTALTYSQLDKCIDHSVNPLNMSFSSNPVALLSPNPTVSQDLNSNLASSLNTSNQFADETSDLSLDEDNLPVGQKAHDTQEGTGTGITSTTHQVQATYMSDEQGVRNDSQELQTSTPLKAQRKGIHFFFWIIILAIHFAFIKHV